VPTSPRAVTVPGMPYATTELTGSLVLAIAGMQLGKVTRQSCERHQIDFRDGVRSQETLGRHASRHMVSGCRSSAISVTSWYCVVGSGLASAQRSHRRQVVVAVLALGSYSKASSPDSKFCDFGSQRVSVDVYSAPPLQNGLMAASSDAASFVHTFKRSSQLTVSFSGLSMAKPSPSSWLQ
jgi:hypothetical protein